MRAFISPLGFFCASLTKGSRKDFYEAEIDLEELIKRGVVAAAKRRMDMILETVDTTENLVNKAKRMNGQEKKAAELYLKRLQSVREIHRFAQEMLDNLFGSK